MLIPPPKKMRIKNFFGSEMKNPNPYESHPLPSLPCPAQTNLNLLTNNPAQIHSHSSFSLLRHQFTIHSVTPLFFSYHSSWYHPWVHTDCWSTMNMLVYSCSSFTETLTLISSYPVADLFLLQITMLIAFDVVRFNQDEPVLAWYNNSLIPVVFGSLFLWFFWVLTFGFD